MNNRSFYFFAIALAALIFCTYAALLSPEALDAIASLLCGESGVAGVAAAGLAFTGPELDFRNLERLPEPEAELAPNTHNPEYILDLNRQLNEQSARLEALFAEIDASVADPKSKTTSFGYAEVLPWRERIAYQKRIGAAKAEAKAEERAYKAAALAEAKAADKDEEFTEGFEQFLATEFDADAE